MSKELKRGQVNYKEILGVSWEVEDVFTDQADTLQILSDPHDKKHTIYIPAHYETMGIPETDYAHELVHASWAEHVDPIFSTIYFAKEVDPSNQNDAQKMQDVFDAQQLIDVWVGDKLWELNENLVIDDVRSSLHAVSMIGKGMYLDYGESKAAVSWAITQGLIQRNKLRQYQKEHSQHRKYLGEVFGPTTEKKAMDLGRLYAKLPKFPNNRDKALEVFELQTRLAARRLDLEIVPTLIDNQPHAYWEFS